MLPLGSHTQRVSLPASGQRVAFWAWTLNACMSQRCSSASILLLPFKAWQARVVIVSYDLIAQQELLRFTELSLHVSLPVVRRLQLVRCKLGYTAHLIRHLLVLCEPRRSVLKDVGLSEFTPPDSLGFGCPVGTTPQREQEAFQQSAHGKKYRVVICDEATQHKIGRFLSD